MVKKGSVVEVRATVETSYDRLENYVCYDLVYSPIGGRDKKCLFRSPEKRSWRGLVIGRSYLATGNFVSHIIAKDYGSYMEKYLEEDKRHVVFKVIPLSTERFIKPLCVLEEDLNVIRTFDPTLQVDVDARVEVAFEEMAQSWEREGE
jgi:hypothetical protein